MAGNSRLRKARKRVVELMEKIERWKHNQKRHTLHQAQLTDHLKELANWEYIRHRVRETKRNIRRAKEATYEVC